MLGLAHDEFEFWQRHWRATVGHRTCPRPGVENHASDTGCIPSCCTPSPVSAGGSVGIAQVRHGFALVAVHGVCIAKPSQYVRTPDHNPMSKPERSKRSIGRPTAELPQFEAVCPKTPCIVAQSDWGLGGRIPKRFAVSRSGAKYESAKGTPLASRSERVA